MRFGIVISICCILSSLSLRLSSTSIVYNFRIAQITKEPIEEDYDSIEKSTALALIFDQYEKKNNDVLQVLVGGLGAFMYNFDSFYVRADFSVAHIKETFHHKTLYSGTQTDDILFSLGKNFFQPNGKSVNTLTAFFGIPTHEIFTLRHVTFGYNQFGTGVQLDGSYALHDEDAFLYGARYLYFVPNKIQSHRGQQYAYTLGNIADLLFAYRYNWVHHGLEGGYSMRSYFGARTCPHIYELEDRNNYMRSGFYLVYKYNFLIHDLPNRLLFNISYSFDHTSNPRRDKYIATLWGSWSISF